MYLKIGVFLPRKDGLMREVRNQKHVFPFLEGKGRRLPENGEHDLHLSLFVEPQNIAIFSHAVDLLLNDDRTC